MAESLFERGLTPDPSALKSSHLEDGETKAEPRVPLLSHPDCPLLELPYNLDLWLSTLKWCPTEAQQTQFEALLNHLCALNTSVNLTRITSPDAFWEKHLWDSFWGIQPWLNQPPTALRAIDVGTGGGFPGIPIALIYPTWQMTLLDSTRKKVVCLDTLCQAMKLTNANPVCERAEVLGHRKGDRASYDLALIRAVGDASSCAEYTLPLLKVGGTAILYRGQWSNAEEQVLNQALVTLGGELADVRSGITPLTQGNRHCLYLRKIQPTPKTFPRQVGIPAQRPLGQTAEGQQKQSIPSPSRPQ